MKAIFIFVFTLLSIGVSQAQVENIKILFSENKDYVLLDYNHNYTYYEFDELRKCFYDTYLSLYGKNEKHSLLAHKDSIYFEFYGDRKTSKNIDSIFCINNSVQYKNRDTSFPATYIFNKMSKERFYQKYELNKVGKLINNEIEYKIENIRDTIFDQINESGYATKLNAKMFNFSLLHKGKIIKKLNLGLFFYIEQFGEDLIDYNKMKKEFKRDFETFMTNFIRELDLVITNKSELNKIVDFKIYNHQKKYYFDFDYKNFYVKQISLSDAFFKKVAFENGKLKRYVSAFYQPVTWDPCTDCFSSELIILD